MDNNTRVIAIDTDGCAIYTSEMGDIWNGGIHFLSVDW